MAYTAILFFGFCLFPVFLIPLFLISSFLVGYLNIFKVFSLTYLYSFLIFHFV